MSRLPPVPVIRPAWRRALAGALLSATFGAQAAGSCVDETKQQDLPYEAAQPAPAAEPRLALQALVREALARSQSIGAAALLAEAALHDVDETRAAKAVQASLGGGLGPGGSRSSNGSENAALQVRAGLNLSQLIYDGGRSDRLTDWRVQLAESARNGHLSEQEQLALTTVTLALERSRLRMQVQVWRQHVRKMGCLAEALDSIVAVDRGRASELVQAKKALAQAELSQTQAQSQVRQVEVRLRRLVGDGLPSAEGLATVFSIVPTLEQLLADVERSYDIAQLGHQAAAASRLAEAVAAGRSPQLSWTLNGSTAIAAAGNGASSRSGSYAVGVTVNIPILAPGVAPASDAARKRAQAAVLQRADALDARRFRVAEVHEQAQSSLDRAKRLAEVLRSSEQVRNFTLQQWQQLGRRSLFDVMGAESEHYGLRVAYVNALHDLQQMNANLLSLGAGVNEWLR